MGRLPRWVRVDLPGKGDYYQVRRRLQRAGLNTVCEGARCPNLAECWGCGTATFMILGAICTRSCRFCSVSKGSPAPPDPDEPRRLSEAAAALALRYIVVTSVDRDDLRDRGSKQFVAVVSELKRSLPTARIELLTPDFQGGREALERVSSSGADVLGHNLETTRSLAARVRDRRADFDLSLRVLETYRELGGESLVKSSLMLGLGETRAEVSETLRELRGAGVDWVTLGQYLRPTRKQIEVARYVPPEEFDELAAEARELGFSRVAAGPLVRSSYRASEELLGRSVRKPQRSKV